MQHCHFYQQQNTVTFINNKNHNISRYLQTLCEMIWQKKKLKSISSVTCAKIINFWIFSKVLCDSVNIQWNFSVLFIYFGLCVAKWSAKNYTHLVSTTSIYQEYVDKYPLRTQPSVRLLQWTKIIDPPLKIRNNKTKIGTKRITSSSQYPIHHGARRSHSEILKLRLPNRYLQNQKARVVIPDRNSWLPFFFL